MINKKIINIIYISIIGLIIIIPYLSLRFKFKHNEVTTAWITQIQALPNGRFKIKFRYDVNNKSYYFYTTNDEQVYSIKIVYNRDNPEEYVFFRFSDIYFNSKMTFIWFLFIILSALFDISKKSTNKNQYETL